MTPKERELWQAIYEITPHEWSQRQCREECDRLLAKARECYVSEQAILVEASKPNTEARLLAAQFHKERDEARAACAKKDAALKIALQWMEGGSRDNPLWVIKTLKEALK